MDFELSTLDFGLSIIGAGKVGGALALALEQRGYPVKNIVSRRGESANRLASLLTSSQPSVFEIGDLTGFAFSEIVLLTVPDPEIEAVAEKLSGLSAATRETIFLHTSGALSSQVLRSLQARGGKIGSLHPLVSISDARLGSKKFAGAYFCLEGDPQAVRTAEQIVAILNGNAFSIATEHKSLYHAAAVMSAGHLVALFDVASETLADCGLDEATARKILRPLVHSTIENLEQQTPSEALTGTFARADLETMEKHLAALANKPALEIYVKLGLRSLQLAAKQGANAEKIAIMQSILESL